MAVPNNYIDKIKKDGDSRMISPAADMVRVDNDNFEGTDLDEVLDEVAQAIEEAGEGGYAPPAGGIPKTDLSQDVQASLDKADTALQSYTETDPTVPSWAKQPTKPTYTAQEVGALPANTTIPTKTSDLSNDSGFVTESDVEDMIDEAVDGLGGDSQEISILFIGNSLTQDAVSYLPLVLKEIAPSLKFNIYMWYDGGYTLTQILNKWNNNSKAEIFSTCENVTSWTNYSGSSGKTITDVISSYEFDIVCLEEYFNYKRENGYTADDKQVFNDVIDYIRANYNKAFKVVSFFHRPVVKTNQMQTADLALADEVFGLTYDGVRWQLENTISEGVIPTGIAAYRAMYDDTLSGLGEAGYMSYEGTHSQEGLPCLMQAWCCALWLLDKLGIQKSINNSQTRVTSSNWSAINVPGPNPANPQSSDIIAGTTAQQDAAMDVAIKAFKEGKRFEMGCISPNGIPAYKVIISGASGTKVERIVQLSASFLPADASADGVTWSIVSGDATVSNNGLVTYSGTSLTASVVVRATLKNGHLKAESTLSFSINAVETPSFSPSAGNIISGQSITISCATNLATIYYTTNGDTPTSASSVYSSPIVLNADTTIKAVAIKNGESSNVASASYVVVTPNYAVEVSDNAGSVDGAQVKLTDGNSVEHEPVAAASGVYYFSVEDGTYTLSVVKSGYVGVTGQVSVNSSSTSTSVSMKRDLLSKAFVTNANCMGYAHSPLYPVVMSSVSADITSTGAYIQAFTGKTRCGVAIHRTDATEPITWGIWSNANGNEALQVTQDAKNFCSLIEWPLDCEEIKIKMTNTNYYMCVAVMDKAQSDIHAVLSSWTQGQSTAYTLNRSTYSDDFYIGIWMKYQASSDWNNNTTLESLGLTIEES